MAAQRDLAVELLELAREDCRVAATLLPVGEISDASVGFHAQQAVEKALKAALIEFPFTHNLVLLVELCRDAGLDLPPELVGADRLTPYGSRLRYGGEDVGDVERTVALAWAQAAIAWAAALIRDPAR